jgi:hypothetical protein
VLTYADVVSITGHQTLALVEPQTTLTFQFTKQIDLGQESARIDSFKKETLKKTRDQSMAFVKV